MSTRYPARIRLNSISEARKKSYEFQVMENEAKLSARIIREYERYNDPTPNLSRELAHHSEIMQKINSRFDISGSMIFFNWDNCKLYTRKLDRLS